MSDGEQDIKIMVAIIRPDKFSDVRTALTEVGVPSLAVANAPDRGSQPAKEGQ